MCGRSTNILGVTCHPSAIFIRRKEGVGGWVAGSGCDAWVSVCVCVRMCLPFELRLPSPDPNHPPSDIILCVVNVLLCCVPPCYDVLCCVVMRCVCVFLCYRCGGNAGYGVNNLTNGKTQHM